MHQKVQFLDHLQCNHKLMYKKPILLQHRSVLIHVYINIKGNPIQRFKYK